MDPGFPECLADGGERQDARPRSLGRSFILQQELFGLRWCKWITVGDLPVCFVLPNTWENHLTRHENLAGPAVDPSGVAGP